MILNIIKDYQGFEMLSYLHISLPEFHECWPKAWDPVSETKDLI